MLVGRLKGNTKNTADLKGDRIFNKKSPLTLAVRGDCISQALAIASREAVLLPPLRYFRKLIIFVLKLIVAVF